jgi:DNA polymerase II large subunit
MTIEEIQEQLTQVALQREAERRAAHEQAMKDLAAARQEEELRQSEAKAARDADEAKAAKRKAERQEAEVAQLREDAEYRRLVEQEENRKQSAADHIIKMKEDIKRRLDELEHAEELAKKQLRDLIMSATENTSEQITPNPLSRFLQHEPK